MCPPCHAAIGSLQRSIFDQNCVQRPVVYLKSGRLKPADAPTFFDFIPDPHSPCLIGILHAIFVSSKKI